MLLLTTINNMVQYQYEGNIHLVYAILRRKEIFYKLARLTLPRAIRDIKQLQKLDFYKSFGGGTSSVESALGSDSSVGVINRGTETADAEVLQKMALTTAPTDLISTTLEERDIAGNVKPIKAKRHSPVPSASKSDASQESSKKKLHCGPSVLDRTGSFTAEACADQMELERGEGFTIPGEHIEDSLAEIGLDSDHGGLMDTEHGSECLDSDDEFNLKGLNPLGASQGNEENNTSSITDISCPEVSEGVAAPSIPREDDGERKDEGEEEKSVVPSQKLILANERKAEIASQKLKSKLSYVGMKARFVPDKVFLWRHKIMVLICSIIEMA